MIFNISDSTSNNTSQIPAVTSSPLAFLFDLHFTTIPRFDWKRYQMVFANIIWRHTAVPIRLVCEHQTKRKIFPPATTFSFTRKYLLIKVILIRLSLPFPDDRRWFHWVDITITFMWSVHTTVQTIWKKDVVPYK